MDKKKTELIAAGLLIAVFILILASSLGKIFFGRRVPRPARGAASQPAEVGHSAVKAEMKVFREEKELNWGRDPFTLVDTSSQSPKPAISSIKLMGITTGNKTQKPKAVINDEIVSVGSKVGAFKVISITRNKVIVSDEKKEYVLTME